MKRDGQTKVNRKMSSTTEEIRALTEQEQAELFKANSVYFSTEEEKNQSDNAPSNRRKESDYLAGHLAIKPMCEERLASQQTWKESQEEVCSIHDSWRRNSDLAENALLTRLGTKMQI